MSPLFDVTVNNAAYDKILDSNEYEISLSANRHVSSLVCDNLVVSV